MSDEHEISLIKLILCLAKAMDLINARIMDHHMRVAYIATSMAAHMKLPVEDQKELLLAAALHDCGALSLNEKLSVMDFEIGNNAVHAEQGYLFLSTFKPFESIAKIIRYHHSSWDYGRGRLSGNERVPEGSFIIHLADRIAVLVNSDEEIMGQVPGIRRALMKKSGSLFKPDLVEAMLSLSSKEYFWFDLVSPSLDSILQHLLRFDLIKLDSDELLSLARLFARIIDFRSSFTATHSSGVATCAETIGRIMNFSKNEIKDLKTAGYLHDIGKLVIPTELLEAPRALTEHEFNLIRSHTYHTYRILEPLNGLKTIIFWAAFHHEHLDGGGYPFHLDGESLSTGARILAVADVFTAITEDRPYRKGMEKEKALKTLRGMCERKKLDNDIVSRVNTNYDEINAICRAAQEQAQQEFSFIRKPAERETAMM